MLYNLTLNEAVDLVQNRPLWRLMSTYGAIRTPSGACQKTRRRRRMRFITAYVITKHAGLCGMMAVCTELHCTEECDVIETLSSGTLQQSPRWHSGTSRSGDQTLPPDTCFPEKNNHRYIVHLPHG